MNSDQKSTAMRQAEIFATEHAANAGQGMMAAIRKIRKRAAVITWIALLASMPHQISYLLALIQPFMNWNTFGGVLESMGMTLVCFAVPIAGDLLIVSCIETIGATAAASDSKRRAWGLILIPVAGSGFVNAAAPGPILIKCLAAFLVTMIPMAEALKFIRTDFRKIDEMQEQTMAQVAKAPELVKRARAKNRKERILQILEESPDMKVAEIAKRAGVSVNHVYQVRRDARPTVVEVVN